MPNIKRLIIILSLLFLAKTAYANPTFVQGGDSTGYGQSTSAVTLTSNVTLGDTTIFSSWWSTAGATLSSVTDNCGGSYINIYSNIPMGDGGAYTSLAYGTGSHGSCTITATYSSNATQNQEATAAEFSGVGALDQKAYALTSDFSGTETISSGNITTTANGDYILGWIYANYTATVTAGSGYTMAYASSSRTVNWIEDQVQSSSGSIAATASETASYDNPLVYILAFKPEFTTTNSRIGGHSIIGGTSNID